MKNRFQNKYSLLILALLFGGILGWLLKPSNKQMEDHQHTESSEDQIWTCSMHPQVRLPEPGQCPICGMDLIPASSKETAADPNPMVHEMSPEAVAMANIHTSKVSGESPEGEIFLTGKVKADERQLASVTAKFPGRIDRLFVNFTGQMVRQGERLATIYSPELLTAQQELLESINSRGTFPELYESAREKLRLWKLTDAQINEIESTGKIKDQFDILAERSGFVSQRNISVGDYVNTGSVLFNIVDLSRVWIMMDAYATDLPFIKTGDEISFNVTGIPGETFKARVSYIDPFINPETRAASVRAEMVNKGGQLKPEMFLNARVHTSIASEKSLLTIPRTSLLWTGKRSVVYVKVPDTTFPSFEMREITIGPRMGEVYVVEGGLEAGEEIVTNGVFAIDAAAQLSGNYSMMMRPESKTLEVPLSFRKQISAVAADYFEVKNALVASDAEAAKAGSTNMENSMDKVDMSLLQGEAHEKWMALTAQLSADLVQLKQAEDLETLREHFSMLSESVLEMTASFGLEMEKVYKDYCPMAFDNKGAYWLSETEEIRNPYYGEAMLNCGEVEEVYLKGQRVFKDGEIRQQPSSGAHDH